jgi:hypothetical protein
LNYQTPVLLLEKANILRPFRAWGQEDDPYLRFHRRLFIFSHIHDFLFKPLTGLWILTNQHSRQVFRRCRNEEPGLALLRDEFTESNSYPIT